jgi:lysophospholipase L1-like esterase
MPGSGEMTGEHQLEDGVKTVLCYGDSNTWGADPANGPRFGWDNRWPGVLQRELGAGFRVIEEGLPGRNTRWDDPIERQRNGLTQLAPILASHVPLDLVIVMLGTNDLKRRYNLTASDIAQSAGDLADSAKLIAKNADNDPARILLVAPPPISELSDYDLLFEGALEKSLQFSRYYGLAAKWYEVDFFDAGSVITSSPIDGIHFEVAEHHKLGKAIADKVRQILG